jgi:hypothetical protein
LAYIDKRLHQLESLVSETARLKDLAVVTGQLDKIRNRREEHRMYGYENNVTTGVLQQQQIDSIAGIMRELRNKSRSSTMKCWN